MFEDHKSLQNNFLEENLSHIASNGSPSSKMKNGAENPKMESQNLPNDVSKAAKV